MLPPIAVEIVQDYVEAYSEVYMELNAYEAKYLLEGLAEEALQNIMDDVYIPPSEMEILSVKIQLYICQQTNIVLRLRD
jgi:hypothetical protein